MSTPRFRKQSLPRNLLERFTLSIFPPKSKSVFREKLQWLDYGLTSFQRRRFCHHTVQRSVGPTKPSYLSNTKHENVTYTMKDTMVLFMIFLMGTRI
jgi:hypothetical protein